MNEQHSHHAAFLEVFAALDRWGPGSVQSIEQALAALPSVPARVLEIGCGKGISTIELARRTEARITAIDTDPGALARLRECAAAAGVAADVQVICSDMAELSGLEPPYDVVWAEGSAYVIGVERALALWRDLLRADGVLVFSDMVWRTGTPEAGVQAFWASEYPDMTTVSRRLEQAGQAGYRVCMHFDMGQAALDNYYQPLERLLREIGGTPESRGVVDDLWRELRIWQAANGQFSYEMFVLQRD
jgi:predicted O-methyltransferase YrrM